MRAICKDDEICLPVSDHPRVIVIGGGFAGIEIVKNLCGKPVQVILLDKHNYHQFQPLLYQVATSGLEPDSIVIPLRKLFNRYDNVTFRMVEVTGISTGDRKVITENGNIGYDHLIIATGSTTNFFGLKDIAKNCIGMKTVREALDIRSRVLQNMEKAVITCDESLRDALTNIVLIGGGPAGVELAGALAEFKKYILPKDYPEIDQELMTVCLIEAGGELIKSMSDTSSENALRYLNDLGVNVMLNTTVNSYDGYVVRTDKKDFSIVSRTVIWTAGVKGNVPDGVAEGNIAGGKRIKVDRYCRIDGLENVYAVGDIAAMIYEEYPEGHPMVAQAALQQGRLVGKNILRSINQQEPVKFSYKDKGTMATIGKRKAVADLGRFKFGGYFAWLLWSFVHLLAISGFKNKLIVALSWAWSYFTYDKGNRLIIRKIKEKTKEDEDDDEEV